MKPTGWLLAVLALVGCSRQEKYVQTSFQRPQTECMVKMTPVKHQGRSELCWIYAMLATIESEHLMQGDSVNLSADYVARQVLEEQALASYLTAGRHKGSVRGMSSRLLNLISRHGVTHRDAYHVDHKVNWRVLMRKVERLAVQSANRREGTMQMMDNVRNLLDRELRPEVRYVFMLGAEYTPQEFARSVCRDNEYAALTSFTHHPFGQSFVLEVTDNIERDAFMNVPLDTLHRYIDHALQSGHPVCWEGDISEPKFSFRQGVALMQDDRQQVTQQSRQLGFESFATTDDHCMELVGIARSAKGKRLYICKNSWGKNNPFGGLMYMSESYLRAKTIAVWIPRQALP